MDFQGVPMTTKYDMTSGEQINRSDQSSTAATTPEPYGPMNLIPSPSLQLAVAENQQKPEIMPLDMASCSISDFLKLQR